MEWVTKCGREEFLDEVEERKLGFEQRCVIMWMMWGMLR